MNQQRALKSNRRDYLREYILACVRDNVLSWGDITNPNIANKLLKAVSSDLRYVVTDLLRTGASNGLQLLGAMLKGFKDG